MLYRRDLMRFSTVSFLVCCITWLSLSPAESHSDKELLVSVDEVDPVARYEALLELTDRYNYEQADSAVITSIELINTALEIGDPYRLGEAYRVAGVYYLDVGMYDQAIDYFYRSIEYFEASQSLDYEKQIARTYHDIAWVHADMLDFEKARKMFHRSISAYSEEDEKNIMTSFHALGSFYYLNMSEYDSAIFYLRKAIDMGENLGYSIEELSEARFELCNVLIFKGNISEAQKSLQYIHALPEDSLSYYSLAYIDYLDGLMQHSQGQYNQALQTFESVYNWIKSASLESSSTGQNLLNQMVKTAYAGAQYQRAFDYLDRLRALEASTIFKDRQRITKVLEIQYETSRKEQLLLVQENQIALQKSILWISITGLVIVIGLLIWVYSIYQKVDAKNKKIEMLMRELHHRVKNNLQVISSLLGLQSMKLEDKNAQKAVAEGKERIRAMSLIHQKLYQDDNITAVNIRDYIQNLVDELTQSYGFTGKAQVVIEVPDISMDADKTLPIGLIINELVSNAFKYAYEDIEMPLLELKLLKKGTASSLIVRDNGKGLPTNFDVSSAQSFGLRLVNLLVQQLQGSIDIQNKDGLQFKIAF